MKIAIVGPIDNPVSGNSTAGTEIWTYNFSEELVKGGHDVTLFASAGSRFSGKLEQVIGGSAVRKEGSREEVSRPKFSLFSIKEMVDVVRNQDKFDLIHLSVYSFHYALPLIDLIKIPVVITVHGTAFSDREIGEVFNLYKSPHYVFISRFFTKKWSGPKNFETIYNGIDVAKFELSLSPQNYFFWMGRLSPEKGVEDAITFAEKTGNSLVLAGPIRDRDYFNQKIKPKIGGKIKYVGELDFKNKIGYYKNAKAFLMPAKWEEPFGLVVIEAMACGTPVIAYNRGALPEIIDNGKTGFIVKNDSIPAMVEAAGKLDSIDRQNCRHFVENNFSLKQMTEKYLTLYEDAVNGKK